MNDVTSIKCSRTTLKNLKKYRDKLQGSSLGKVSLDNAITSLLDYEAIR